jgi:hypothetical protein
MINLSIPEVKTFVDYVKQECKANGIKVELRPTKYVKLSGNIKCSGYFDDGEMKLVVSAKNPQALEILAHEFGHFTQWMEQTDLWLACDTGCTKVDEWLSGKRVNNIKEHLSVVRDLELDNEKRAVMLIKKFKLPIDIKEYTRKANAYVLFYNWLHHTRRWCTPQNTPYRNKTLLKACSTRFNMKYDELSPEMIEVFEKAGL